MKNMSMKYELKGAHRAPQFFKSPITMSCALDVSIDYLLLGHDRKRVVARNKLLNVNNSLKKCSNTQKFYEYN